MTPYFERVTIIGVGLLGASLGLAVKARTMAKHVVGVGHRQSSLDKALEIGAIDEASMDAGEAVRGAALVVVATPAALVVEKLEEIRPACGPETVVTDVASTKASVCAYAQATWPAPRRFIGSHPMAGSEKFGPEHGRADLFSGSVCLVEKAGGPDSEARGRVVALWRALGAEVVDVDPALHDILLARTSHVPHVLAAAAAALAVGRGDVRKLVGNGFRDSTRIAAGRPEVWRDICLTNREAILEGLGELGVSLDAFRAALEAEDGLAVQAFFEAGRAARRKAVDG